MAKPAKKRKASGKKSVAAKSRRRGASGRRLYNPNWKRDLARARRASSSKKKEGFLRYLAGRRSTGKTPLRKAKTGRMVGSKHYGKFISKKLTPKHVLLHRIELLEKRKKKAPKDAKAAYARRKAGKGSYMPVTELERRIKEIKKSLKLPNRPE